MKKLLASVLFMLCMIVPLKGECAYHYIWNNDDYIAWINDKNIITSDNTACFDIVIENRRTGKQDEYKHKATIYRDRGDWYIDFDGIENHPISYYKSWWQPYGLDWLIDNGFLH